MSAKIGLGTYLQNREELLDVLDSARKAGIELVDTATNYGGGTNQKILSDFLHSHPAWCPKIITKVGFVTDEMFLDEELPDEFRLKISHRQCFLPEYINFQVERSARYFNVESMLLHNPENQREYLSEIDFEKLMVDAFSILEQNRLNGMIRSYGVSVWSISSDFDWNTAEYWAKLCHRAVGHTHGFGYFEHPVNLVDCRSIANSGSGGGDIYFCMENNIATIASSPLRGGEIPEIVGRELASLINREISVAHACFLASMSVPGLDWVLTGARRGAHIDDIVGIRKIPPIPEKHMQMLYRIIE